jgi:6-pyruvoyl-tetrahydropterin synthase
MFELDVETSFSAGHSLWGYLGKCENCHGHNYKVRLTVTGEALNEIGLSVKPIHQRKTLPAIFTWKLALWSRNRVSTALR